MRRVAILLAFILVFCHPAFGRDYVISMLPRYYPEKLTSMMTPLAEHLSSKLGGNVKLVLAKNFHDYENKINNGMIDIGFENPLIFSKVRESHQAIAMAVDEKSGDKFRGIVISRPDSGVGGLKDLVGKDVMIVSDTSAGGYLSQLLSLNQAGINPSKITFITAAENRQENVIIPVSTGDVDAGFIRESAFGIADKYILPGSVVKIEETAWLPNWALSVNRNLPVDVQQNILNALLSLKGGDPVLKALSISHFKQASDSDYSVMESLVSQE
jgi:phosphonate transport system substrate-binding protein